jgi:hypothetical protein
MVEVNRKNKMSNGHHGANNKNGYGKSMNNS